MRDHWELLLDHNTAACVFPKDKYRCQAVLISHMQARERSLSCTEILGYGQLKLIRRKTFFPGMLVGSRETRIFDTN